MRLWSRRRRKPSTWKPRCMMDWPMTHPVQPPKPVNDNGIQQLLSEIAEDAKQEANT